MACNNDGVWNEAGTSLSFVIAPAWYQTIWFRGLYVLAFFTLLWAGYQMRVHQLQEQEKKFRDAVETMPALAFVADPEGSRTFFNRGWLEYTGLSPEQASGSGWEVTIHPDDLKRGWSSSGSRRMQRTSSSSVTLLLCWRDGTSTIFPGAGSSGLPHYSPH